MTTEYGAYEADQEHHQLGQELEREESRGQDEHHRPSARENMVLPIQFPGERNTDTVDPWEQTHDFTTAYDACAG